MASYPDYILQQKVSDRLNFYSVFLKHIGGLCSDAMWFIAFLSESPTSKLSMN